MRQTHSRSIGAGDETAVANDPDELVRTGGVEALRAAIATRQCGFVWRALKLLEDVEPDANLERRKQALARAGDWLGALPPRLALEQEDALAAVAERCGYSVEAVQRAVPDALLACRRRARDDPSSRGCT